MAERAHEFKFFVSQFRTFSDSIAKRCLYFWPQSEDRLQLLRCFKQNGWLWRRFPLNTHQKAKHWAIHILRARSWPKAFSWGRVDGGALPGDVTRLSSAAALNIGALPGDREGDSAGAIADTHPSLQE